MFCDVGREGRKSQRMFKETVLLNVGRKKVCADRETAGERKVCASLQLVFHRIVFQLEQPETLDAIFYSIR